MADFTLELLHFADQEAGVPALQDAPNFSAVLEALKLQDLGNDGIVDDTLILSSGDAIIPGLFFSASEDVYGGAGRADILIQNELGVQAIAFGNHEFDLGTALLADLIGGNAADGFAGTAFPYLSANLDFTPNVDTVDSNGNPVEGLADYVVPDGQAPQGNSIAASTVLTTASGEKVGVVGATTPTLATISSPGNVGIAPIVFDGNPTPAQLDALAAEIQADVDALLVANPGLNKVVLLAHMQQISIEKALATRLSNVDIIVAGGSNTRQVDSNDRLRDGDTKQDDYPFFTIDADGNPIAVVNTDGNYKYVGRLVIDFDANGNIIPGNYDPDVSGAYATDDQGVADLGAAGLVDPEIQAIVDALEAVIVAKESNVFGASDVFLEGRRSEVRTQETNLGNLTADANLAIAKQFDSSVVVSIKNGGGIRDDIGRILVPAGGTGEAELLPNEEIPGVKPEGGISETDIVNTLRFNNDLTLLTVTAAELLALIEHGVANAGPGTTSGRFPQVGGLTFSFDTNLPGGDRVQSLAIVNDDGSTQALVENSELVVPADSTFRIVTLGFLAGGGDGYPFPQGDSANRVNLIDELTAAGTAGFAAPGTEQDALAEYLATNFGNGNAYDEADTAAAEDLRIQNLTFRSDNVLDITRLGNSAANTLVGDADVDDLIYAMGGNDTAAGELGNDAIYGGDGDDVLRGDRNRRSEQAGEAGGDDIIFGGAGNDRIGGKSGNDELFGEDGDDQIWGDGGDDLINGGAGNDILFGDSGKTAGADTFQLAVGEGIDIIKDYNKGGVIDTIQVLGGIGTTEVSGDDTLIKVGDETLAVLEGYIGAVNFFPAP
jgi:2',3'-cyclic-nucleotide 2'-phosphodiesterase (5'-nucleotidase family)